MARAALINRERRISRKKGSSISKKIKIGYSKSEKNWRRFIKTYLNKRKKELTGTKSGVKRIIKEIIANNF